MVHNAHFVTAQASNAPVIIVRDDRGAAVTELELPAGKTQPEQADEELRAAGWNRSADWTPADDGWVAPVVAA